jgi:hypothetical protein
MKSEEKNTEEHSTKNLDEQQKDFIVEEIKRITRPLNIRSKIVEQVVENLISNLPEMIKRVNLSVDIKQITDFILLAENDVNRAKDAYRNNDFNNTIFHLQQSIEKVVKAYGMYLGIIEDPRTEIGHNTPKVYFELLENTQKLHNIPKIFGIKADIKAVNDFKALIKNKEAEVELDKSVPIILNTFKNVLKQFNNKTTKIEIRNVISEVKNKYGIDIIRVYRSQIFFSFFLCPFSIITSPYAVDPRYSIEQKYKELNLIKCFPDIQRNLERLIAYIKEEDATFIL